MKIDRPIEDLLDDLIRLGDAERATYLDDIRNEQPQLCERLERLLTAACNVGSFMEYDESASDSMQGSVIGSYVIREQIGEGGMGVVYVAEQTDPVQRKVALKIIKPGMDTKEVIARFEAERQALAFMEHPNIARVLDAGATDSGRSYFVMELVRGIPITEYCDQVKATPRERLELFQSVCDAVQHAHQKGIIHRDIKPSNVLVTQVGAKPIVKVIDFGLAKAISGQRLTEKTLYTGFMKLMGTPAYMSPEQAGLSGLDVDTRSDIYSLGVLLYELLTGTTPLDKTDIQKQAYDELCRQIREADTPKPSTRFSTLNNAKRLTVAQQRQIEPNGLRQLLDGDLDHVVLKAIEKDRDRRYRSPQDLIEDVQRFLDDKPVQAVPPSQWYLLRKYLQRHKVAILITATVLTLLLVATVFSTWQAIVATRANKLAAVKTNAAVLASQQARKQANVAERERQIARDARQDAIKSDQERRRLLYASNMQLADHLWNTGTGTPRKIQDLLLAWIPTDEQQDLRDFAWRFQWNRLHLSAEQTVMDTRGVTFSTDGKLLVSEKQEIREWREAKQDFITQWSGSEIVALSPCGRWAVAHSKTNRQHLRLIDVVARKEIREVAGTRATFSSNGEYVVVWHPNTKLVDYHVFRMGNTVDVSPTRTVRGEKTSLPILSSDGRSIALSDQMFWLEVHILGQPEPLQLTGAPEYKCATSSPNGRLFVSGHFMGEIRIRFAHDLEQVHVFKSTRNQINAVAFSRDSKLLAAGSAGGTIDLYDVSHFHAATGAAATSNGGNQPSKIETLDSPILVSSINAHVNSVQQIVFSHDGSKLVTRDSHGTAKLWDLNGDSSLLPSIARSEFPLSGRIQTWWEDTPQGIRLRKHTQKPGHEVNGQLQVGDRVTAISDENGFHEIDESTDANQVDRLLRGRHNSIVELRMIDGDSKERLVRQRRQLSSQPVSFGDIEFTKGAQDFVVNSRAGAVNRSVDGQVNRFYPTASSSVSISPDGRLLALDDYSELVLWDLESDTLVDRLPARVSVFPSPFDTGMGGVVEFSADGRYLAMGTGIRFSSTDRSDLKVWDVATRTEIGTPLFENEVGISGVVFAPDNRSLVASDRNGVVRIWNTSTWEQQESLQGLSMAVCLDISPDGRWLAQGGPQGIAIWDFQTRTRRHVLREESVWAAIEFSRDGRTLLANGLDGKVTMWDVETGTSLTSVDTGADVLSGCKLSPDDGKLAVTSWAGDLWVWDVASMEEIDQHLLTIQALFAQGKAQNEDAKFAAAEKSLARVLRTQLKSMPPDHKDVFATKSELKRSLKEQDKFPIISKQPISTSVQLGDNVSLSVDVMNETWLDFNYQWFLHGEPINNATQPTLNIQNVTARELGRYHVEISVPNFPTIRQQSEPAFLVGPSGIAKGGLKKEVFFNIPDGDSRSLEALTDAPHFPNEPDVIGSIRAFELPSDVGDEYGARMSGFLVPPTTGNYVFYLNSDDSSQLFLSTDESRDNLALIAKLTGHSRGWRTVGKESVSPPILLQAGRRYWVETLYREQRGADRFSVTWQMPDHPPPKNGDPPIPGEFLEFQLE